MRNCAFAADGTSQPYFLGPSVETCCWTNRGSLAEPFEATTVRCTDREACFRSPVIELKALNPYSDAGQDCHQGHTDTSSLRDGVVFDTSSCEPSCASNYETKEFQTISGGSRGTDGGFSKGVRCLQSYTSVSTGFDCHATLGSGCKAQPAVMSVCDFNDDSDAYQGHFTDYRSRPCAYGGSDATR